MNKYEILNLIGEGSFGRVYKVRRISDYEIVALKVIRKNGRSQKEIKGLRRECEIQQNLHHPNIIEMLDSFETENEICVVTEFAHKELHVILGKEGFLSEERVRIIVWDLVSALYYLHSHRVLHRDLKPQNILIDVNGIAKLCDFGFARNMSTGTHVLTSIKGTPLYMAPELIEEQPYDHSVDLWSLGCIIYELLVGVPPFCTTSILHLVRLIRHEQIKWPQFISENCFSFLQGLLQKYPSKRMTWKQILSHPFVEDHILITDDKIPPLGINSDNLDKNLFLNNCADDQDFDGSNDDSIKKNEKNETQTLQKGESKVSNWNLAETEQPIECEEWLAFLHRIMKEILNSDFTSLSQSHLTSVIITPLRNPISSCKIFENIAYLLGLPFVIDVSSNNEHFEKILNTYIEIKLVPNLIRASQYVTRISNENNQASDENSLSNNLLNLNQIYKLANDLTADETQCLESIFLLLCNLINRNNVFLSHFCDAIAILNAYDMLRSLLNLHKIKVRIVIDLLGILIRILCASSENFQMVEQILFNDETKSDMSDENDFLTNMLKHSSSSLRNRSCIIFRLLAKNNSRMLRTYYKDNDNIIKDTLEALMFDSIESVRNAAEESLIEIKQLTINEK